MRSPDCGVYTITSPSGKVYVGSSRAYKGRRASHLYALRRGKHSSDSLQREFDKCGAAGLVFALIEVCDQENLVEREQAHLDAFARDALHNNFLIASVPGRPLSDEAKHERSQRMLGNSYRQGIATPKEIREVLSRRISAVRNTSGFNGVSWRGCYRKWEARVRSGNRRVYLGRFHTPEEANEAIQKYKEQNHV